MVQMINGLGRYLLKNGVWIILQFIIFKYINYVDSDFENVII
jgi:hypothetical protein